MDQGTTLLIGDWRVSPALGQISRDGQAVRLEARTMRLLMCLADRAGDVVSIDELLDQVWSGVIVTPDSVYQAVAQLRRSLGDDPKQPSYIATVPRLGYRLVAAVSSAGEGPAATPSRASTHAPLNPVTVDGSRRTWPVVAAVAALCFAIVAGFLLYGRLGSSRHGPATSAAPAQNSVEVLPFLDLTSESMDQEFFADGMTEELIDRLSKIPGLRVAPPTSSFYFKDKKAAVADIAKSLGVAYILDGSLRKSGSTMRVAARLVRADSGFVVWTETYDRRVDDNLKVQDDIAGEVTKALMPSIAADQGSTALPR
jgi:TolB-like protein/DNA-binding winged helix-turn-helix (wHTH) protein